MSNDDVKQTGWVHFHAKGRNWNLENENQSVEDDTTATSPLTIHECEYCHHEFVTAAELKCHKHKSHQDKIARQKPVTVGNKGRYRFTCIDCSASFKTRFSLKRHMVYHSDIHDHMCTECGKTFLHEKELRKHSVKHSKVKPFRCDICFKFFKTEDGRKLHALNFHGPIGPPRRSKSGRKSFQCGVCGGMYASRSALQKHELVHERDLERKERLEALVDFSAPDDKLNENDVKNKTEEENIQEKVLDVLDAGDLVDTVKIKESKLIHECDECGKKFPTNRDLKTHKNGHNRGKSSFDCDVCGRVFLTRISLYRHRHIHTKSGKYTCRVCGKKYASLDYLIKHGKLHNAEPPFKCDVCQKGFHEKRYMQYHLATHTKEKPYMCDQCGRTFRTPQQQKDHAMTHSDERPHSCDICGKAFKLRDTLRVHKQTHETALNFMCGTCGRRFNRAYNLRKHEKVHMDLPAFICKDCGKACKTQVSLKSHWISFHLKPEDVPNCKYTVWQCDVCSKPFAERMDRDVHMRTHTGEKPFTCDYCGKAFADKSNLRAHVRNHQGDKSKLCGVCGKGFTFNRDLKKHMLIHCNTGPNKRTTKKEKVQTTELPVLAQPAVTTATLVRPVQVWSETPHPQQQQQQPRLAFHQDTITPRIGDQIQHTTTVVEVSAEAMSAAYALTMASREATMQQMTNPAAPCESEDQNEEDEDVEEIPAPTERNKCKCEYCKKKFETADELVKHTEKAHQKKMASKGKGKRGGYKFTCKDCKFSFKTRTALKHHKEKCLGLEVDDESAGQDAIDIFKRSSKHFPVKPFKCNKCKRFFKTSEGRRLHSMNCTGTDTDEMSLTCKICSGTYANKSALIKHEQAHEKDLGRLERLESLIDFSTITPSESLETENEATNDVVEMQNVNQIVEIDKPKDNSENWKVVHKCDECDRKFGTIRDLRNHQSGHRKGKVTYDCDQCSKVYINKIALYRHQQVHSKSGLYTCKVCNRDYSSLDNLIKHGKVHQGDPPFKCDICNKGFYEKRYLQWHINAHLKIKPYMCDQCGKAFPRPGQLREHRRVHSDERPYKCDICGKCFKLYDTMRNHKDTHNTLQNFVCHTCGRRFNRAYNLRKHQKIHSEVATYICDECGKGFKNSTALKSHFIAFHLKPEDVKNCKYTVHQCDFCLKPFAEKVDRDCHMRTHTGEKPFSCEICGKTFANKSNMRSHVRNHQGEKSKLCNICGKGFSFNRDLKKHMLSHNRTNDDQEKQKAMKKPTAATVRPQSSWTDCQHAPPPPPPAPPAARQYHHDNVSPRHQDQLQQTVMEASAEALSAAYALTMAREATMQQMGNPGSSSEFSWQFL